MLSLKLNLLKNHLADNLLLINSNDCAFSLSTKIKSIDAFINIILNNIDNEILIISTFIKLYNDYLLMRGSTNDFRYRISVNKIEDCTEIIFVIILK